MTKYTFHPLSDLFPRMSEEEFKALVEDIRANGLRQPIVTYQSQILDGRHRYDAANEAKRELTDKDFTEFKPTGAADTPLKYVVSQNVNRRHLNESQRAIIAAGITDLKKGANQYTIEGRSIDLPTAAKMLNIGEASVKRAKKVLEKATPEIVDQVRKGTTRVSAVTKEVLAKPKDEQVKALKKAIEVKEAEKAKEANPSDAYDKAQDTLIKKLQDLKPEAADAAVSVTTKKLKETVATMMKAAASTKEAA